MRVVLATLIVLAGLTLAICLGFSESMGEEMDKAGVSALRLALCLVVAKKGAEVASKAVRAKAQVSEDIEYSEMHAEIASLVSAIFDLNFLGKKTHFFNIWTQVFRQKSR